MPLASLSSTRAPSKKAPHSKKTSTGRTGSHTGRYSSRRKTTGGVSKSTPSTSLSQPQGSSLTEDALQEFREIFKLVDKDDSGDISREELFQLMKQIGLSPTMEQVNEMLAEVDIDNNGTLDFEEFITVLLPSVEKGLYSYSQIMQAFRIFDPENKGFLSVDKLEHILTHYGDDALSLEEAIKLINTLDNDRKGKLDYEKYCSINSS